MTHCDYDVMPQTATDANEMKRELNREIREDREIYNLQISTPLQRGGGG